MKVDRLETHDRLLHVQKQADYVSKGCQDCIKFRPKEYENHPFYIFAHKREIALDEKMTLLNEDIKQSMNPLYARRYQTLADIPSHRMIWCPRLTKPTPQPNSMCFMAFPPSDNIRTIWILPDEHLWPEYEKGKMMQSKEIVESILNYKQNRKMLEAPEPEELPNGKIRQIMRQIGINFKKRQDSEAEAQKLIDEIGEHKKKGIFPKLLE